MTNDKIQRITIDWALLGQWILASTLGWVVGWILSGDVGVGTVVGITQWLVLRREIGRAGWWILATAVGWTLGWAVVMAGVIVPPQPDLAGSMLAGAIIGLIVGLSQWLVLRLAVDQAGWWVLASTIGWAVAMTGMIGWTLSGAAAGALTGLMLDWLLRFPRQS